MRFDSSDHRVRGFTIAEVLVSLAVFTFAVMGIVFAMDASLTAARTVQKESYIRSEMQSRLALLSNRPSGEYREEFPPNLDGVTFQQAMEPEEVRTEDATLLRGFWKLSVKAAWSDGGEPQEWELSHLEYRP